jgi:hypothetical protein
MTTKSISSELLKQVENVVNSVANIVISRWLESKNLPHSPKSLKELALTICKLIVEEKIELEDFQDTFLKVEECSGKVIYLKKVPDLKLLQDDTEILRHVKSRLPAARSKKFETVRTPDEPTLNYLYIDNDEIRIKFSETHFKFSPDFENEVLVRKPFTVIIVFSINRKTGFTLIYMDSPGQKHPYPTDNGKFPEKMYFDHYLEKIRIIFPKIQVADFGQSYHDLLRITKAESRVLKATTNSDLTNDNVKRVLHGTDLMTAPTFSNLILNDKNAIIHDYATVNFLRSASEKKLLEDVFVRIYPGEGKISIPSVRLPFEVDYVISRIKSV